MREKSTLLLFALVLLLAINARTSPLTLASTPTPLDPTTIPKWENQITGPPPVYVPVIIVKNAQNNTIEEDYIVNATSFSQQILPQSMGLLTPVWGYGGLAKDAVTGAYLGYIRNSPAPSFEATRGVTTQVTWINNLTSPYMFAVDPTLHWANPNNIPMAGMGMPGAPTAPFPTYPPGFDGTQQDPSGQYYDAQSPVPLVTHLHGGETPSTSDGDPDQWFTANGTHGSTYYTAVPTDPNAAVYRYLDTQEPTTLWYHDHALGLTRINVYSGLAGFYLLRDPADAVASSLPSGGYEIPLAIQDRSFLSDGSLYFPSVGDNPGDHPYWNPEFFGNTIMVNGLVWPNMNVNQTSYRFRILDGSNARFYNLMFNDTTTNTILPFTQIGTDGGYLKAPVTGLTSLLISPGERGDILCNFTSINPGDKIILQNDANAPYPAGDPEFNADPNTTGQIMQFTVTANDGPVQNALPSALNPTLSGSFPNLPPPTNTRILTLTEVMGEGGPLEILLDGQKWSAPISEMPVVGTTEEWTFVDTTSDTHPIHLHLIQFQLVQRQDINDTAYLSDWVALNGNPPLDHPSITLDPSTYLIGLPIPPAPNEQGWKDTIQVNPGQITTIRVRFAAQDGSAFPFDATVGPGYVWHCHIIDHEDNEMMRPFKVVAQSVPEFPVSVSVFLLMGTTFIALILLKRSRHSFQRQKPQTASARAYSSNQSRQPYALEG